MEKDNRQHLAEFLERDAGELPDGARLVDDLALDSLAMMSLLTWLETNGVAVGGQGSLPATVGEVLSLLDKASFPGLSIRVTDPYPGSASATDVAPGALKRVSTEDQSLAPVLASNEIRFTPVGPDDIRPLYALATHPQTCYRWRYRGVPPPIERFAADLWSQVLVQFVARDIGGEPVGHVVAYGADVGQGYAYIGTVFQPQFTGAGLAARASMMFVRYLFHAYPLRKLYIEVPGFNWPQLRSGEGRLLQVEGIMRDHEFYAGRHWDRYLCAIYRDNV